jgi:ABC-type nitrate/sulfonate/bicarbonate transport system ATPase subunit
MDVAERQSPPPLVPSFCTSPSPFQLADRVMSPRPGVIDRVASIDLARPRTIEVRESPQFHRYVHETTEIFFQRGVLTQ